MKGLDSLLNRILVALNKEKTFKKLVIETIKKETGIILDTKHVFIKDGVLEIDASPAVKNEIKLKEDSLKTELKISRVLYK